MSNITWSSSFPSWCLRPSRTVVPVFSTHRGRREGCVWAATEPFVLNNLPAIWRPESEPRQRGAAAAAAVHLRFNWEHFVSPLSRTLITRKPTRRFLQNELMRQTQDLIRFDGAEEQRGGSLLISTSTPISFFCHDDQRSDRDRLGHFIRRRDELRPVIPEA